MHRDTAHFAHYDTDTRYSSKDYNVQDDTDTGQRDTAHLAHDDTDTRYSSKEYHTHDVKNNGSSNYYDYKNNGSCIDNDLWSSTDTKIPNDRDTYNSNSTDNYTHSFSYKGTDHREDFWERQLSALSKDTRYYSSCPGSTKTKYFPDIIHPTTQSGYRPLNPGDLLKNLSYSLKRRGKPRITTVRDLLLQILTDILQLRLTVLLCYRTNNP